MEVKVDNRPEEPMRKENLLDESMRSGEADMRRVGRALKGAALDGSEALRAAMSELAA